MKYWVLSLLVMLPVFVSAQTAPVFLNNASFEDTPGAGKPPWGWFFCGPQLTSPPDVHPSGMYGVEEQARHGRTYVGMVVRDVNTWELIGQRLEVPLRAGRCYRFSIWMALPQQYLSLSRQTGQPVDYSQPAILRIWGGRINCENAELLAASDPVYHHDWKKYTFILQPEQDYSVISLEAYYMPSQMEPYCGSLLLDHASPLLPIDCETGDYDFPVFQQPAIPNTWDQARSFLRENSQKVALKPGNRSLQEQLYENEAGDLTQGNLHLHAIARCLRAFPEASMIIRIPFHNNFQYRKCREHIAARLNAWRLPSSQWKIKKKKGQGLKDQTLDFEFRDP